MTTLPRFFYPFMTQATIRPRSRRRARPHAPPPSRPLTSPPQAHTKMLGDLQESFRHGEDAPIAFMDVEAHLINKAKMMCNMWDEEGRENGAISEMATEAVWRRIPSNIIPPPLAVPQGPFPLTTPAPRTPDLSGPHLTTRRQEICMTRLRKNARISWLRVQPSSRS